MPVAQWAKDEPFFSSTSQCYSCTTRHHMVSLEMTSWYEKNHLFACFTSLEESFLLFQLLDYWVESPKCWGRFCDKGQKCKISLNLPFDSLEMFICRESSPKFQMYNEQKDNGVLTRKNSKCHNWNTRKCWKSTHVRNFNLQLVRRENWERLREREGRFPCAHICTPKLQNCENVS